jgi:hypothetical protein
MDPLKTAKKYYSFVREKNMHTIVVTGEQMSNSTRNRVSKKVKAGLSCLRKDAVKCLEKFIFGHLDEIKRSPG